MRTYLILPNLLIFYVKGLILITQCLGKNINVQVSVATLLSSQVLRALYIQSVKNPPGS